MSLIKLMNSGIGPGDAIVSAAVDCLYYHDIAIHRIAIDNGEIQFYVPRSRGELASLALEQRFIAM
ncbi:MAG: hypothetical protein MJE77_16005 [Proteobacteria bacterium]|nr:hypothetical protein [Pseudomonadota bacterium]